MPQGFASLFANAISMAIGELLSEKAERQWIMQERSREMWEFDNAPEVWLATGAFFSCVYGCLLLRVFSSRDIIQHTHVQYLTAGGNQ